MFRIDYWLKKDSSSKYLYFVFYVCYFLSCVFFLFSFKSIQMVNFNFALNLYTNNKFICIVYFL